MSLTAFQAVLLVAAMLVCRPTAGASVPTAADKDSEKVKRLLKERVEVLKKALKLRQEEFKAGRGTLDSSIEVIRLLHKAELEAASTPAERITAHEDYFKAAREAERAATVRHRAGLVTAADTLLATAGRLTAEIGLRRAGGEVPKD